MKFNKILAIALAAFSFTACNDDDNSGMNTADVTVSMQQDQISVSEDVTAGVYYNIPVVLDGVTNGPVKVTIEVSAVSESPATENTDYLFTDKTITIPAGEQSGVFEFYPTGDDKINDDRKFVVTITNAEGAKIGNEKTCIVTLLDNERLIPEAHAKVLGNWAMTTNRGTYPVVITGFDEGDENYLKAVKVTGIGGQSRCVAVARFNLDATSGLVTLSFDYGQVIAKVSFTGFGEQDVLLIGYDGQYIYPSGAGTAVSNEDINQFTFAQGFAGAFNSGGWRAWWMDTNPVMSKIQ